MPDAPHSTPGPSKAARLVGNTGPQPAPGRAAGRARSATPQAPGTPDSVVTPPTPSRRARVRVVQPDLSIVHAEQVADEHESESLMEYIRRRFSGDYAVDEFGFDPEFTDRVLLNAIRPLYRSWFRVEASGLENVPDDSAALIVGNHSGTVPWDALMAQVALHDEHPAHRHLRMLGANLVFQTPVIADIARKAGHTLACHPDAERLLAAGQLVGVWPEGFKGIGKPFSQRYKLQRFGRGGFVAAAIRTGAPIIPTAIVGGEEIYPMIANAAPIARLLGLPYFPITPTFPWLGPLGMVPLPSKWLIHFGEPIPTDGYPPGSADDPMVVFDLTDQVREQIQQSIYRLLVRRPSAFG